MKQFFPWAALCVAIVAAAVLGDRLDAMAQASSYTEETKKINAACNSFYEEMMKRDGRGTVSIGDVRAMFMLHKLGCDLPARVSGAFPQP